MVGLPERYPQGLVLRCFSFGLSLCPETLFDLSVINAEELVCSGCHVDLIGLTLGTFLVQEAVDGIVDRLGLE